MAQIFSYEEVLNYCRTMLGYPKINVELDTEHYRQATLEALRNLSYNRPKIIRKPFSISQGVQSYTLTDFGYDVIDVEKPPLDQSIGYQVDIFNPFVMVHPLNLGEYELSRMYANELSYTLTGGFEFEFDPTTGTLLISPPPAISTDAVAVCVDEWEINDLKDIWVKNWVKDYALAKCKIILGTVRRKIQNVQGSELTFDLDGETLVSEGKEELQVLMENIKTKSGDFTVPIRSTTGDV